MMTSRFWGNSRAVLATALSVLGGMANGCNSGSGGGEDTAPPSYDNGYQEPNSTYQVPSSGAPPSDYQAPMTTYQEPSGSGSPEGQCPYCGHTYSCAVSDNGQSTPLGDVTLEPGQGGCAAASDGGLSATFSCNGTVTTSTGSMPWAPYGSGGFSFQVQVTVTTVSEDGGSSDGASSTTSTVTCTPTQ